MNVSAYTRPMRLRTLPLSVSGVLVGMSLAAADYRIDWRVAILTLLTTICLQILSNLGNSLGDYQNGVDREDRMGPEYSLSTGDLSVGNMKRLIAAFVLLCIVFGTAMIWLSFGTLFCLESICLLMLGAAAIGAAIRYTLGRNPYGYRGLGDIYVFLFFGLAAVLGSYFVAAHTLHSWILVFPATSIGLLSVAVLNVNNIRDMATDEGRKVTLALTLGLKNARLYQTALVAVAFISMIAYCLMRFFDPLHYLFLLTLPLFMRHLRGVWTRTGKDLDAMLPLLSISTLIFSVLICFGFTFFLLFA